MTMAMAMNGIETILMGQFFSRDWTCEISMICCDALCSSTHSMEKPLFPIGFYFKTISKINRLYEYTSSHCAMSGCV